MSLQRVISLNVPVHWTILVWKGLLVLFRSDTLRPPPTSQKNPKNYIIGRMDLFPS